MSLRAEVRLSLRGRGPAVSSGQRSGCPSGAEVRLSLRGRGSASCDPGAVGLTMIVARPVHATVCTGRGQNLMTCSTALALALTGSLVARRPKVKLIADGFDVAHGFDVADGALALAE